MCSVHVPSNLIRNATLSQQLIGLLLDHRHHDRTHSHCVQDADGADDEDEWREDEWVPHHPQDVIVGEVSQQDIHEHRRASAAKVVLKTNERIIN